VGEAVYFNEEVGMRILFFLIFSVLINIKVFATEAIRVTVVPTGKPNGWVQNGEIMGISVDLMKIVFSELDIDIEPVILPWARSLSYMKDGKIDCILTILRSEEREEFIQFSLPYSSLDTSIFVKKGKAFPFNNFNDLIGKNGMSIRGEFQGEDFDSFRKQANIYEANSLRSVFSLLNVGRYDYAVYVKDAFLMEAERLGFSDTIEALPMPIMSTTVHIGFSKKSKYLDKLPYLDKRIKEMDADGTIEKLIRKNLKKAAILE
jgi:polar amino acid transport system substrate-binding protein